jgi:hypothetical protein
MCTYWESVKLTNIIIIINNYQYNKYYMISDLNTMTINA